MPRKRCLFLPKNFQPIPGKSNSTSNMWSTCVPTKTEANEAEALAASALGDMARAAKPKGLRVGKGIPVLLATKSQKTSVLCAARQQPASSGTATSAGGCVRKTDAMNRFFDEEIARGVRKTDVYRLAEANVGRWRRWSNGISTWRNLASRLLSMTARRIAEDWQQRYGYRPVLLETFVETPRFLGTCYKAANWMYLGNTQGRGKLDVGHKAELPKKTIWVYPLAKDFRRQLCS
ncbi:MAG: Druantia anti-phage system protein DruA [Elusimicrobiota bacterium]